MARADEIERAYRERVRLLLEAMTVRLEALYGAALDTEDIDATFAAFAVEAANLVEAGQAAGVALTLGHLRSMLTAQVGRTVELAPLTESPVGRNEKGEALILGMAAIPSLMKIAIRDGHDLGAVRDFGRSLVVRFADAETTRAMDTANDQVSRDTPEVVGWEGIVSGNACEGCQGNAGTHSFDEEMYRHGGCNCQRVLVTAEAA